MIANEKLIFIGIEESLKNLEIEGKNSNLDTNRWFYITQNDDYFFTIEINYSPQINSSINNWEGLKRTLNSFIFLES